MPKVKGPKKRKGRQLGAPEDTNRFRAAYKKSVKIMQEAIGMATDEAKFPGIQTGNGPISANKPDPVARAAAKAGTSTGVDISGVLQDIAWAPQDGPQTALLTCPVEDIFFGGARGGGKLTPLFSKVCTPKGWVEIGSLRVGDEVTDPTTGGNCLVIGVHPQGVKDIYKVTCDDGATCLAGLDHLWSYKRPHVRRPHTKKSPQREFAINTLGATPAMGTRWDTLHLGTTATLIEILKTGERPRIPLTEPVIFTVNGRTGDTIVTPYLIGVMLGDGHIDSLTVTACDDEVRDYLTEHGFRPHQELHTDGKPKSYSAYGAMRTKFRQWVYNHGLKGHRAWEKFIPPYVLTASLEYRLDVLRGLMDTDGTADDRGRCFYTSTSKALAEGVREIARSLGGKASIRERVTSYTYKGEKKDGRPSWTVRIWMPRNSVLFNLSRKRKRCTDSWNGGAELMREIVSIEQVESAEAVCITVGNARGLYVTDDFIVTHNSDALLGDWLMHRERYGGNCRGLLVRRTYTELEELIQRSLVIYPATGAQYSKAEHTWYWPDGAILRMRYLEADEDAARYMGFSFTWIGLDEMGNFPSPKPIDLLWATLRSASGIPCVRRSTGNPGGPGTQWIKERYIDPSPPWVPFKWAPIKDRPDLTIESVFIPSKLEDNLRLMTADPRYEMRLAAINDPEMFKAWRDGDWTVLAGRYFSTFTEETCVVPPIALPPWLPRWISVDWGFAHNSAVYWAAYDGEKVFIYDELVVDEKTPIDLAKMIVRRTALNSPNSKMAKLVLSPDAFSRRSSQKTIASEMAAIIPWQIVSADNDRIGGWNLMRQMFAYDQLKIMNTCPNLIKKLKVAQRDPKRPEDVLKHKGDDELDSARYLIKTADMTVVVPQDIVINDAIKKYLESGDYMNAFVEKLRLKDAYKKRGKPRRIAGVW